MLGDDAKSGAKGERSVTTVTEEVAVAIFVAKHSRMHSARDSLASELAAEHSITSKSVRGLFCLPPALPQPYARMARTALPFGFT